MKVENDYKTTIVAGIIVAVLTVFATNFFTNWGKIDDTLTRDQVQEMVDRKGEEILERSRRYTHDQVSGMRDTYEGHIENIEKIIKAQNEKFEAILNSIDDRLNRIDKRIEQ